MNRLNCLLNLKAVLYNLAMPIMNKKKVSHVER